MQLLLLRLVGCVTTVPDRPLLAPWYRLVGDGDRLLLEHAQVVVVLEGAAVRKLLPALLPLVDGTRTVDDLVARLGVAARPAVELALETLASHGLLVPGPAAPEGVRASAHALAAAFGVAPSTASQRLAEASVGVVGGGGAGADAARLLRAAGVEDLRPLSWRRRPEVGIAVVAPGADELDWLEGWNRSALDWGVPWILVRPFDGRFASVSPLVVPGESPCYECVLLRRGANLEYRAELADIEAAPLQATADPPFDALVAAVAAHVTLWWLVGHDLTLPGIVHVIEARPAPAIDAHPILRVPRCPVCSETERVARPLPWHAAEAA